MRFLAGLSLAINLVFACPLLATAAISSVMDADELLVKNKYAQAEDAYRGLLDSDETGDAYAGLAVSLAKQNTPVKILEAEKILRMAREKYADNSNVIAAGGYVSYIHSKTVASPAKRDLYLEAAETLCKRAIKANPDILIAQQTLGQVRVAQDDIDGAVDPFRKAAALAPDAINLTFLAQSLLHLDRADKEAADLIEKALGLKSDYPPAHLQKALILAQQGKPEDAFMELRGIAKDERSAEWYCVEGDIYRKQGDGPGALASWRESIRQDPHSPDPYKHMAEYHAQRGDGEFAINDMHSALEILPNDLVMRSQLADLALHEDKLDVAETEYKTILVANPDDAQAILGLAHVGFRKARKDGQYPPGWQKLMDQLQNVVTEQSVKGQVLKGAKNLKESIQISEAEKSLSQQHFRDARKAFGGVINAHREESFELLNLGEQAYNDGDLKSAEQAYNFAKQNPDVAQRAEQGMSRIADQRNEAARQTTLGNATWKTPDVAVDHYKQALIADPQYANAYYGLFSLFARGERPDPQKAIEYATSFLEAADDNNPLRKEVEIGLVKLKKKFSNEKKK